MTRSLRLISTNPSPAVGIMAKAAAEAPKRTPLISSEAREREKLGLPFYGCAPVDPKQIPAAYLSMTAYPRRVERKTWRTPVSVAIGVFVGLAALGLGAGIWSLLIGGGGALACTRSDGWSR